MILESRKSSGTQSIEKSYSYSSCLSSTMSLSVFCRIPTTSSSVFFPTSDLIFQAVNICPAENTSSISSSVRPFVSGNMKNTCMNAAKLNVPKMKYVLYAMEDRPGGTAHASAKLKSQLAAVETATAFARTRMGKISAGYVQETGPIVTAKEQTKR